MARAKSERNQGSASKGSGRGGSRKRPQKRFYAISVVARMLNLHPQTLRMYERLGLVQPRRDQHNQRMYDEEDIERIRKIQHFTQQMGVNLAGVEVAFKLMERIAELERQIERMKRSMDKQVEKRARILALQMLDWLRHEENMKLGTALKLLSRSPLIRADEWEAISELLDEFISRIEAEEAEIAEV
ncbi:MAG TPA: MerR family transcriptional regulator [Armatimonadetes bacterium]|nr:MerR family transcriptional regulator [Armatimonadota bacterium]